VADIFCGAGGFSLGFERAGFTVVFAIDSHHDSVTTFNENFGEVASEEDVAERDFSSVRARVLIGGPPCQPYSLLGKGEDVDSRTGLTSEFMRAVREVEPDVFLIENVPGYLDSDQAGYVARVAGRLDYVTAAALIDAKDHGVPQSRARAFILGSRLGIPFFPAPLARKATVKMAIGDLSGKPTAQNWHVSRSFRPLSLKRFREISVPGGNRFDLPNGLRPPCWKNGHLGSTDVFGRLWWDRPSVTIRTEFIKPEKGRYLHPVNDRPLTPREGARLQSFPDSFRFLGSTKSVVQQIGNAVPPRLAYRLALAVKLHLEGSRGEIAPGTRRRNRLVTTVPCPITPPSGRDVILIASRLVRQ
jgi:DNA (cytosine-5)-methyltransferase 1